MKAAYIAETGDPEVLQYGELPEPRPGAGEVLVQVGAVAVNPIDTYIRSGAVALPIEFPYVVGCDLAGTVEAVGEEVSRFVVGDRSGAATRACSVGRGRSPSTRPWARSGCTARRRECRTRSPPRGRSSGSRHTSACSSTAGWARGRRSSSTAGRGAWGRRSCSWPSQPGRG